MMTPTQAAGPVRVSIIERLVPSLGLAVTALAGVVGAVMIFRFISLLRLSESAGYYSFFAGVLEIEFGVTIVLIFATILTTLGGFVALIRLFTTNTKSSPPGFFFLILGLLSLVPPLAIHYVLHLMKGIVTAPESVPGGISSAAGTVEMVSWFALAAGLFIPIILLAFSLIPFSSRPGRKASPIICLILVAIAVAAMTGIFAWEASTSLAEKDKQVEQYSQPKESPTMDDSNSNQDFGDTYDADDDDTFNAPANTSSNSALKMISGGVLNSKAKTLPQPEYPPAARAAHASGAVSVRVIIDEEGNVVSADAVSGHPLLKSAAVAAARSAKFAPTKLRGQPVKVSGVITYTFTLQ